MFIDYNLIVLGFFILSIEQVYAWLVVSPAEKLMLTADEFKKVHEQFDAQSSKVIVSNYNIM